MFEEHHLCATETTSSYNSDELTISPDNNTATVVSLSATKVLKQPAYISAYKGTYKHAGALKITNSHTGTHTHNDSQYGQNAI